MIFAQIPKAAFEELTSLEKAAELATDREKWYIHKKIVLGLKEFDDEREGKIWEDFNRLMLKAVSQSFAKGDYELLQAYRRPRVPSSPFDPYTGMKSFPTQILSRDEEGRIETIDVSHADIEITASLFDHIFGILVGRVDVRCCAADDCHVLFIPRRTNQTYHSLRCRERQAKRRQVKRKRSKNHPSSE